MKSGKQPGEALGKVNSRVARMIVPKQFRRGERSRKNRDIKRRNDGKTVGSTGFMIGFGSFFNSGAIYAPRRKKLKGWQKENRKYKSLS